MNPENATEEVLKAMESSADPSPAPITEEVSSEDVKPVVTEEVTPTETKVNEPVEVEKVNRFSEQPEKDAEINKNLKIALQEEREERKALEEKIKKLESSTQVYDKIREAFSPTEPEVQVVEEKKFLTEDEVQALLEQKEAEKEHERRQEEERRKIISEIDTLTSEWN